MSTITDAPWSAAFISWVLKQAIARTSGLAFPQNKTAHTEYAQEIRTNRAYPFDVLNPIIPAGQSGQGQFIELVDGDIIVFNRADPTTGQWNTLTYTSNSWSGVSHGDIVTGRPSFFRSATNNALYTGIGGNLSTKTSSGKVTQRNITESDLLRAFVVLRAKSRQHRSIIKETAVDEARYWDSTDGKARWDDENQEGARQRVNEYWLSVGLNWIPSQEEVMVTALSNPPEFGNSAITPFIGSLESFHPKIQYELTRRRVAAETANTYMPFVKLTSLMNVKSSNLTARGAAWCPSLGMHGNPENSFKDIYYPQDNRSIIGYATSNGTTGTPVRIPVVVSSSAATTDQRNIPIPGITEINAERSTAGPMGVRGGLLKANIKIAAYSVGQVDALLTYFLRPATRVVLELGRMSSNKNEFKITPYDWNQPKEDIQNEFSELIVNPDKQKEFIKRYIYNNYGNYELFICYVANFNLKYNKNNTYEINLTVHSVQQFEVPTKHTGVKSTCASPTTNCKTMDVQEYFNNAYSWKQNSFSKLMSKYLEDNTWSGQIIPIRNQQSNSTGAASSEGGTRENEYFISWRFFVEKVLNDATYGIASMLGTSAAADLAILRISKEATEEESNKGLIANQVGYHPNLRSVNPEVMVVFNPRAQSAYETSLDKSRYRSIIRFTEISGSSDASQRLEILNNNNLLDQFYASSVPFENTLNNINSQAGASYLYRGVWLNTKAIKQAFTSADTISSAISNLLNMMNSATEGYWNLQLYSTDVNNPGMHIIDMGLSKPLTRLESKESKTDLSIDLEELQSNNILDNISGIKVSRYEASPNSDDAKYIYMFNRKTKLFQDGELGSDLLDLAVDFNLPQVIAVQAIANIGGPAQKGTLQSINVPELRELSLIQNLFTPCNPDEDCISESACEDDALRNLREEQRLASIGLENARLRQLGALQNAGYNPTEAQRISSRYPYTSPYGDDVRKYQTTIDDIQAKLDVGDATISLGNPNLVNFVREYADLGTALELIEINPSRMMKQLNIDSTNLENGRVEPIAHAFNSSNLTKTVADVTLPGIGGINLFQSFLIDRVPSILERGFYVVTKVIHKFTAQTGWTTQIQGRFRYRLTSKLEPGAVYTHCKDTSPARTTSTPPNSIVRNPNASQGRITTPSAASVRNQDFTKIKITGVPKPWEQ